MQLENPDIRRLRDFFEAKNFTFASDIYVRPNDPGILVSIPEVSVATRATATTTSKRKLLFLKSQVARELALHIEFLFVRDTQQQQMEAGLNALLHARYPGAYENGYLSSKPGQLFDVWLEPIAEELDNSVHDAAKSSITEFLKLLGAKTGKICLVGQGNTTPAPAIILRETKRLAPVAPFELASALREAGFVVPSTSWLERKLDSLRRKGMVIRLREGAFVLTEIGLKLVPYGKNRRSSDVERALALGRFKWQ